MQSTVQALAGDGRAAVAIQARDFDYWQMRLLFSVGGGAARLFGDTRLHFSAEWFAKADEFTVLDSEPFEAQTSGEIIDTTFFKESEREAARNGDICASPSLSVSIWSSSENLSAF